MNPDFKVHVAVQPPVCFKQEFLNLSGIEADIHLASGTPSFLLRQIDTQESPLVRIAGITPVPLKIAFLTSSSGSQ